MDGKNDVYACFLGWKSHDSLLPSMFRAFYKDVILTGIKNSDAAKDIGIWDDLEEHLNENQDVRRMETVSADCLTEIQKLKSRFHFRGSRYGKKKAYLHPFSQPLFRVPVVFVVQFFGGKEVMKDASEFNWFMNNVSSVFEVDEICDKENEYFEGTKFYQDIAITLRYACNPCEGCCSYLSCTGASVRSRLIRSSGTPTLLPQ